MWFVVSRQARNQMGFNKLAAWLSINITTQNIRFNDEPYRHIKEMIEKLKTRKAQAFFTYSAHRIC